jgi:hypothetical protein
MPHICIGGEKGSGKRNTRVHRLKNCILNLEK